MGDSLHWWLNTDAGLLARIGIGASIFVAFAIVDLVRRGRNATRWREYLFLVAAAGFGMAYGVINDRIASSISWEYFYYGKGLDAQLGPHVPPDPAALRWAACEVGLKATWSVGLIIGVALLIANNPRKGRPQLPYRTLLQWLPIILLGAGLFACAGAFAGSRGWLVWMSADLRGVLREDLFRPHRFLAVYGMNLGGYMGGAMATVGAVAWIVWRRRIAADRDTRVRPSFSPAPGSPEEASGMGDCPRAGWGGGDFSGTGRVPLPNPPPEYRGRG